MLAAFLLLAQSSTAHTASPRAAVERALPALQQSARTFVANRSCASCHHNILPILTFRLAATRGFAIDRAVLESVERRTFRELTSARAFDDAVQGATVSDPTPNDSWLLVAAHEAGLASNLTNALYARRIASWQHDGHWSTSDFRPPHSSSLFTATATAVRAIRAYLPDEMAAARDAVLTRARRWLVGTPPASTEDATFRLLGLVWAGAARDDVAAAARDLLKLQRPGGGWAQLPDAYAEDAYSTGEALYALHEAGTPTASAAWRKGIAFLLSTQAADGTWHVRTRMMSPAEVSPPYFATGFPYEKDEYISYAASCWATMALLSGLPAVNASPPPAPIAESLPVDPAGAMRAALLGSAAQLSSYTRADLKVDVATPNGTTILMAAGPDIDKVTLLLAAGADPAFRSAAGYDAATAAASYRGSAAAIRALLDAGANVEPPEAVKVRHSPLLLASMSGDLETVSLLLARGANANPRPNVSGGSPIAEAITFNRADVVRELIRAGARTTLVERTGVNLLHWATITNRAGVIQELARSGVEINAVDDAGFTPLMYAATIDFGDTATLAALLAAGADGTIKNDSGRTPLQQARRLGHTRLARALAGAARSGDGSRSHQ
jgi:ankyrin repeat protein